MKLLRSYAIIAILLLGSVMMGAKSDVASYVGNKNTKKFHRVECRYVAKMSDKNKVYFDNKQEAVSLNYTPCKVCKP